MEGMWTEGRVSERPDRRRGLVFYVGGGGCVVKVVEGVLSQPKNVKREVGFPLKPSP